mmetsp:Transcript_11478/g.17369  ORF Transcript_11478/g.17369 Transcript_11478/m.17369 type:complete len:485 (+) Transcript_11478:185-1639(+)
MISKKSQKSYDTTGGDAKAKDEDGIHLVNGSRNKNDIGDTFFGRSNVLGRTVDVDSVDGSYSFHSYCTNSDYDDDINDDDDGEDEEQEDRVARSSSSSSSDSCVLPEAITGVDGRIISSIIEHCIVANENQRVRCFLLYTKQDLLGGGSKSKRSKDTTNNNNDDEYYFSNHEEERLARVVICHEHKLLVTENDDSGSSSNSNSINGKSNSGADLLNMIEDKSNDVNLDQLSAALGGDTGATDDNNDMNMVKYPMSMMSLSLGPWLGDLVIRDKSFNDILPRSSKKKGGATSRGFGAPPPPRQRQKQTMSRGKIAMQKHGGGFGEWVIGVQKVAMQFKWDYGSTVRHCLEFGKSMGCYCENWPTSSMGTIYEERMSRRLKPEDRSLYIDYDMGAYCGFIVGSAYVKAPRILSYSKAKNGNPIHTEFALFQRTTTSGDLAMLEEKKETWCSRITRMYSADGLLKQGTTSFFTLKPIAEVYMDDLSP